MGGFAAAAAIKLLLIPLLIALFYLLGPTLWGFFSNVLFALLEPAWQLLLSLVSFCGVDFDALGFDVGFLVSMLSFADFWIPLSEAGTCLAAYWGVSAGVGSLRWVLRFTPFVG